MPPQDLKQLGRRYVQEVINKHDVSAVDQFLDPNFVDHNPIPGVASGVQGHKQQLEELFRAFPDIHATVDVDVVEGDTLVLKLTQRGSHKGDFQGLKATGKPFRSQEVHIMKVLNGKVVEHWGHIDALQLAQQLGLAPANIPTPEER